MMPSPLETFLHQYTSGQNVLTQEMYDHYGGDDILKQIQKYDPNAKWTDSAIGGGEGGEQGMGKRLDFDITKMPKSKGPDGKMHELFGLSPSNLFSQGLKRPEAKWDDELYGNVTDSGNFIHKADGFLEKYAPYIAMAISMGAPIAAGALAAGGIGLGAAGATSAITGGAAGLGAGQIPGALGAGSSLGLSDSLLQVLGKSPTTVGRQISNGRVDTNAMMPMLLRLFGR